MMDTASTIAILPFRPEDQPAARALILAGLAEHWGTLDPALNPDLDDIASAYAGALFLVAWQGSRIVGTGALVPCSQAAAEIVRMSVAASLRRQGIGRSILQRLCNHARSQGLRQIILETTATWQSAIAFYQRFGFHITHYLDGDVYFALDL